MFGDDTILSSSSSRRRLFINFDSPSQCNGRVTGWNYCYWRDGDNDDTLGVRFLVYRRDTTTGAYHPVPDSLYTLTVRYQDLQTTNNFGCGNVTLDPDQQFDILLNDIVSACMIDDGTIKPLFVTHNSGQVAYYLDSDDLDTCADEQLMTITEDQVRNTRDNVLTVHASISKFTLENAV